MTTNPTAVRLPYVLVWLAALALPSLHAQTTNCTPAPSGLVAWWQAEGNALDSAGANAGALQPGAGFADGAVGQAFYFNGDTNSYVEVPDSPALELTNELTIEFWVKRLRLTFPSYPYADYIVEKGGDWTGGVQNYGVALHNPAYNYCLHFTFAGGWRGAGSIADTNTWHHCAVVARNGDANPTFYIDGVQQPVVYSEGAGAINLYPSTRPLHIGALLDPATGWYYFSDTLVDELSIYSRTLTAAEIQAIYAAGSAGKCTNLVQAPSACEPPPAGLVSWWRAENSPIDAWGNNDATFGYSAYPITYTNGEVGRAFSFSGSTLNYLRVPDALSLHFTNALSVEGWVLPAMPQGATMQTILAKWTAPTWEFTGGTNSSFFLGLTNNGALCLMASPENSNRRNVLLATPAPLPAGQWSHVAATYDGAALRLYVNGSRTAQTAYAAGLYPGTADLGLGAVPGGGSPPYAGGSWPWVGALDELSLYNRALSDDEILALYNADAAGKCLLPPTILVQPQSQAVPLGEDVLFGPTVQGTKPMVYQWRFNGQNLLGSTNATLLLEKVQSNRSGSYSVLVTNSLGRILSSNAVLTLLPPPVCVSPPPGMVSWWPADGSPLDAAGTNNIAVTLAPSITYRTGKVDRAFVLTNAAPPFVNSRLLAPDSPSLNFGSNADFSIEAWLKYTAPGPRLSPPFTVTPGPVQTILVKQTPAQVQPPLPILAPTLGYSLLLDEGRLACWLGAAPGSATNSATFVASGPDLRDGMFHHIALTLQRDATNGGNLYVDGQVVLTFDPRPFIGSLSNSGAFFLSSPDTPFYGLLDELTLYNRALNPDEVLAIRQAGAAGKCKAPPAIITQPISQFVNLGANAAFAIDAEGSGLLHYLWRFNGVPLLWANNPSLTVTNAQLAGTYSVLVTNAFGLALSSNAILTLNHPPVASCANLTVAAGPNCVALAFVDNGSYDPDGDPITLTQTPPGPYPPGTNLVSLTATDPYGLSNSCTALVVVVDQTPPLLVCPPPVVQANDLNQCGAVVHYPLPTATDLCSLVTNLTSLPPPGSFFPVGITTVQCSATDAAGNVATNSFTVTVQDTQPPSVTCPPDITVTNAHDAWTSVVSFNPTATDNCPGVGVPVCNPASGSTFSLGVQRVTCWVADAAGNTNQCSFIVTVLPGNLPPIPVIQVAPLAHFPGDTNLLVIAALCASNATVYFDGSQSYDPDDATFNFAWYEGTNCFATTPVATNNLALGQHDIVLRLDDTFPLGTNTGIVTLTVLSPAQAVAIVSNLVSTSTLAPNRQHPLQVSLDAAIDSFGRCDLTAGLNQLQAFENKVRAQVAPSDPALADALLQGAAQVLTALSPGTLAGGPALKLQSLVRQPDGRVRLTFAGKAPRVPLVQASTNLADWTTLGLATNNGNGSVTFQDYQAISLPIRFYRLTSP